MEHHTLSRRELLLAAGATALAGFAPASAVGAYDVIVVGAGAAGIAAAKTIQSHGRSVLILEAMHRIGGRTETDNAFAAPIDLGAQHFSATATGENTPHAIAKNAGLSTIRANAVPLAIAGETSAALHATYASLLAALHARGELAASGAIHDTPAYDAIRHLQALPHFRSALAFLAFNGASLENASLIDYHNAAAHVPAPLLYPADDTEYIPTGMGNFMTQLARDLPIELGIPVTSIAYGDDTVTLRTSTGTAYRARTAIITASTGVLASKAIAFEPALPTTHLTAIEALPMGNAYKAALVFTKNLFANHDAGSAMHAGIDLEHPSLSFVVNQFEQPTVVFSATGELADRLEPMPRAAVAAHFLKNLEPLYPGATTVWDGAIKTSTWSKNPYTRGASSYATIGNASARATLAEPIGDKLWFAGEATSSQAPGQMHGAWEAGVRAARGALAALGVKAASPA